jgi:hypothetical protein
VARAETPAYGEVMGRPSAAAFAVAICVLAVGCGAQKKNVTTERLEYRLSVSASRGSSVGERIGSEMSFVSHRRPLTRAAAEREVRAYMRRHYGVIVDVRCARDGQFMACSFPRRAGCAELGVANGDNGATPIVVTSVLAAPRSSCP